MIIVKKIAGPVSYILGLFRIARECSPLPQNSYTCSILTDETGDVATREFKRTVSLTAKRNFYFLLTSTFSHLTSYQTNPQVFRRTVVKSNNL